MRTVPKASELSAPARRRLANENNMKKKTEKRQRSNGLRPEYDLAQLKSGVRGKYYARYRAGTNLALLSRDVAPYFLHENAVNTAMPTPTQAAKATRRRARRA